MKRNIVWFDAEFGCLCGSLIGVRVNLAIVESRTGAHVTCRHCARTYAIRPHGAEPLSKWGDDNGTS